MVGTAQGQRFLRCRGWVRVRGMATTIQAVKKLLEERRAEVKAELRQVEAALRALGT